MTPDELRAKGYSLEVATWGVVVFLEGPAEFDIPGNYTDITRFTVQFDKPEKHEDAVRIGWEAAQADFVERRLA